METIKDRHTDDEEQQQPKKPNKLSEHIKRFEEILDRGMKAGVKDINDDFKDKSLHVIAGILAYAKILTLVNIFPVKKVPDQIEEKLSNAIEEMDQEMTKLISAVKV